MASALVQEAQDVKAEMSFAPMIDCVFQLLIFFLVCSRMKQTEEHIKVYLPTDEGVMNTPWNQKIDKPEPVYVLVQDEDAMRNSTNVMQKYGRKATYFINTADGVPYKDPNQLREALKPLLSRPDTELIIYPLDEKNRQDQKTPWKNVIAVVDAGYWAGFTKIKFRPPRVFW
ncbi:MAG TPA: biopolymer transporter ExbD [Planctomycetota bacterium]|nr:biopolymer transporter ExbD [Planctomycetota bacterium]